MYLHIHSACLKIDNCYQCLDNIRIGIAAFIFTGGLALIFDSCVVTGVIVELGLLALEAIKLRYCGCLGIYQTIFVHLLLLTILLSELKCGSCCKTVQSEEKKAESVPRKRSE